MSIRLTPFLPSILAASLLGGCAASVQSAVTAGRNEPDCSFRSASTCWTLGARFPSARTETRDSAAKELLRQAPRTLARRVDTRKQVP
jgi:hypothetical protein